MYLKTLRIDIRKRLINVCSERKQPPKTDTHVLEEATHISVLWLELIMDCPILRVNVERSGENSTYKRKITSSKKGVISFVAGR